VLHLWRWSTLSRGHIAMVRLPRGSPSQGSTGPVQVSAVTTPNALSVISTRRKGVRKSLGRAPDFVNRLHNQLQFAPLFFLCQQIPGSR
jgi:hypothetical protein